ncbi:hypothetical protein ACJX0J_029555, partial [Zea mays]
MAKLQPIHVYATTASPQRIYFCDSTFVTDILLAGTEEAESFLFHLKDSTTDLLLAGTEAAESFLSEEITEQMNNTVKIEYGQIIFGFAGQEISSYDMANFL